MGLIDHHIHRGQPIIDGVAHRVPERVLTPVAAIDQPALLAELLSIDEIQLSRFELFAIKRVVDLLNFAEPDVVEIAQHPVHGLSVQLGLIGDPQETGLLVGELARLSVRMTAVKDRLNQSRHDHRLAAASGCR